MSVAAGSCTIVPDFTAAGAVTRTAGTPRVPEPVYVIGTPSAAVDLRLRVTVAGPVGTARVQWSTDGGGTWSAATLIPDAGLVNDLGNVVAPGGQIDLGTTGLRARFAPVEYLEGEAWSYVLPHAIGAPVVGGSGFAVELANAESWLWWQAVTLRPSLPDPLSEIQPVTTAALRTLYEKQLEGLALRCSALAAVFAPHLGAP